MNIRIFFSSPGDVKMERETAKRIVDRLQSEVGENATIDPYFWEHEVMVATKDYQENIPQMDDFDIVVCILWSRLGTPLDPDRHPRPGGGGFASGTEYEFVTAMQAHELKGTPDIFVFRNTTEPRRPSRPKEVREAVDNEIDRLDTFFDEYFQDDTFFTRAINIYSTLGEFEEKLTIALRSYITGRIPTSPSKQRKNKPTYHRQPYLGLAAFDYDDAPVFFGRTAQIGEIITAFQTQEMEAASSFDSPPKHFVLILGSSGSGKSSLARAGVMPMLSNPGVIEGANSWRIAMFKPADVPGDPILALVQSLNTDRGLPELFADGTKPKEIADLIRTQPEGGGLLLRQALTQAGAQALIKRKHKLNDKLDLLKAEHRDEDADLLRRTIDDLEPPAVRIALLADQLEELFTSDLSPDTLDTFIGILVALANSGRIFILATLRSDFYPRCLEHPALISLMQGSGTYGLPAPSAADIGQMIRQPAAIAGLSFEENTVSGENLDELLRDEALKDPTALPLLSYTLEQLYEQRTEDDLLTLQAYKDLGGLEGAIGSRAETVFTELPTKAQAAFDPLCKQLVTLQDGGQPTRRRASYTTLTRSPDSKTLVDALVNARLLTADQSTSGERIISVAHEALLRHWPRLVSWVEENRLFLNTRTRVASRLADWKENNKSDDYLIPRGPNLSAAESILAGHLSSLDPLEIEFIGKSIDRVRQADQKKLRTARMITAGAVVLCLIAVAGGIFALSAKRTAQKERNAAIEQERLAKAATAKAIASEARSAYINGIERLDSGKNRQGLASLAQTLAIESGHKGALSRIYSELLYSLPRPVPIRSVMASSQMRQRISGSYSQGNQYITYIAADKSPEVFDLKKKQVVDGPWKEGKKTVAPALTYYSDYLLDAQEDGEKFSFKCWNILTGKPSASVSFGAREFLSMLVTTDGKHFVFALSEGKVELISTETGETTHSWKQSGNSGWVSEIPEKFIISTFADEVVVFNLVTKEEKRIKAEDGFVFQDGRVGLDSEIFVAQSYKQNDEGIVNRFRFYDANTAEQVPDSRTIEIPEYIQDFKPSRDGEAVAVAITQEGARIFDAFDGASDRKFPAGFSVAKVEFSHDGRHLITATEEGTVNIFDIKTREPAFAPIPHEGKLEDLVMTWNGQYMLTASGTTATIWDLAVGTGVSMPVGFPENPTQSKMTAGTLTVQTPKRIYRVDTSGMKKDETSVMLSYISPLVSPSLDRTAALIEDGLVNIHGSSLGDKSEVVLCEWQCPAKKVDMWSFSDDGSLFIATADNHCWVVNSTDGTIKADFEMPGPAEYSTFITPDRKLVFNLYPKDDIGFEYGLHGRDIESGKDVELLFEDDARNQLRSPYYCLSPDSRWLAIASVNTGGSSVGITFLWDLHNLSTPARELVNPGSVSELEFSPDGAFIAIASHNNGMQIRSLESTEILAPTIIPGGTTLHAIEISPDSSSIALATSDASGAAMTGTIEAASNVSVWDWREAVRITRNFRIPNAVSHLNFTPEGRTLFAIFPRKGNTAESILQAWEIAPPSEMTDVLLPLAEAATAYHIEKGQLPAAIDPFLSWEIFRESQPDSWFLASPEDRGISPSFDVEAMRWIKDDLVEIDGQLSAMPCVALSNAAIAHWRQTSLNKLLLALNKLPEDSEEYEKKSREYKDLADTIAKLQIIPERNPDAHPLITYYLALQARSDQNDFRLKKYSLLAYKRNPGNADCADLAAKTYEDAARYKEAEPILRKIRELVPDDMNYRFRLGTTLWQLDKKSEAQSEFAAALADDTIPEAEQAIMLVYMGRGADALPLFQSLADSEKEASGQDTYSLDSLVYLITGHLHNDDNVSAIEYYRQLILQAPGAAQLSTVEAVGLHPLLTSSLIETLALTLEKHPDLAPADSE
ncbi:MAG: nSTAND1 domain-containing NTPase [Luteolibacter sp.]